MKRSEINATIKQFEALLDQYRFRIPPYLSFTPEEWADKNHEWDEIRDNMLGWDITDYGEGDFEHKGLALITLRNGNLAMADRYPKTYAEKLLFLKEGQYSPNHFHWHKMEDIITIESAISDTELTIEQLSGTLRNYDALVDYATVYVNLEEVYKLSNTEEPSAGFASRMGTAFSSGWKNFVAAMESFAVALAYGWVWLVLLAAIAAAFVALSRRSRARKLAKKAAQPAPTPKKPEDKPE